jgi:hypothetical protein
MIEIVNNTREEKETSVPEWHAGYKNPNGAIYAQKERKNDKRRH